MHSNTPLYLRVKTNHTHTSHTSSTIDRTGAMENERRLNLEHQPKCSAPGTKPRTVRIRAWANWLDQSVHAKRESATTTQPTGRFVRRATFASALIYFRMQRLMRPSDGCWAAALATVAFDVVFTSQRCHYPMVLHSGWHLGVSCRVHLPRIADCCRGAVTGERC